MENTNEANAKVLFRVPEPDGSAQVETLWAVSLGDDKYLLENSPFFAYSVSWQDIVYAPYANAEGHPTFSKIISKSGNRTIRVILDPPLENGNSSEKIAETLVQMKCSYEGTNGSYLSVNIPPEANLDQIRQFLIEKEIQFEHADPKYDDLFQETI